MAKKGRPTTYFDLVQPRLDEIESWAGQGLTREEIAVRLGINKATLHRYMNDHAELRDSLKEGDEEIVANIEGALIKKALAGDVTAMIFALKNKAPRKWRENRSVNLNANIAARRIEDMTIEELERFIGVQEEDVAGDRDTPDEGGDKSPEVGEKEPD